VTESAFKRCVAGLAVLRIVPPLIVLAANGRSLPTLPGYAYAPPEGDTYGFYAAAREFISVWSRTSKAVLGLAVVALIVLLGVAHRLSRRGDRGIAVAIAAAAIGLFISVGVHGMRPSGAGAVGWPIVWSLPMFPLRAAGLLSYHVAFYAGIAILLACNVVTVAATAAIARRFAQPRIALVAPALLVAWPFLMRFVDGTDNAVYGSWLTDTGNLLYSEPLSTALVTVAAALLLLRRADPISPPLAGALIGFATAVRVSDVTIAAVMCLVVVLWRDARALLTFVVATAGVGAISAVFWSRGYGSFSTSETKQAPNGLFSPHYLLRSWRDSDVFTWKMLVLLLPLAVIGAWALRLRPLDLTLLGGIIVVTAVFYSAYYITALHPRFLFVALPPLFVLITAGVALVAAARSG
jgi:Glycosyltransferase family 87